MSHLGAQQGEAGAGGGGEGDEGLSVARRAEQQRPPRWGDAQRRVVLVEKVPVFGWEVPVFHWGVLVWYSFIVFWRNFKLAPRSPPRDPSASG